MHGSPWAGHESGTGPTLALVASIVPPAGAVGVGARSIVVPTGTWFVPLHTRSKPKSSVCVEPPATVPRLIMLCVPEITMSASPSTESATTVPAMAMDRATAPARTAAIRLGMLGRSR